MDLEDRQIGFFIHANDLRAHEIAAPLEDGAALGDLLDRDRQQDLKAARSRHDVCIGDDVSIRVDDDTRTHAVLAGDQTFGGRHDAAARNETTHEDLDDAGTDPFDHPLERTTQLVELVGGGRLRFDAFVHCNTQRQQTNSDARESRTQCHDQRPFVALAGSHTAKRVASRAHAEAGPHRAVNMAPIDIVSRRREPFLLQGFAAGAGEKCGLGAYVLFSVASLRSFGTMLVGFPTFLFVRGCRSTATT